MKKYLILSIVSLVFFENIYGSQPPCSIDCGIQSKQELQNYLDYDFFDVKESILFENFGWFRETKRLMIESHFKGSYDVARSLLESYLVQKNGIYSVPKFHNKVLYSMNCSDKKKEESHRAALPNGYYDYDGIPKDYYVTRMINYHLYMRDDLEIEEYIKKGWQQ